MTLHAAMETLHLDASRASELDARELKRAYLRGVKQHSPEHDPDGFQRVRSAFDALSGPVAFGFLSTALDAETAEAVGKGAVHPDSAPSKGFDDATQTKDEDTSEADLAFEDEPRIELEDEVRVELERLPQNASRTALLHFLEIAAQRGQLQPAWYALSMKLHQWERTDHADILAQATESGLHELMGSLLATDATRLRLADLLRFACDEEPSEWPFAKAMARNELVRRHEIETLAPVLVRELDTAIESLEPALDVASYVDGILALEARNLVSEASHLRACLDRWLKLLGTGKNLSAELQLRWLLAKEMEKRRLGSEIVHPALAAALIDGDIAAAEYKLRSYSSLDYGQAEKLRKYYEAHSPPLFELVAGSLAPPRVKRKGTENYWWLLIVLFIAFRLISSLAQSME